MISVCANIDHNILVLGADTSTLAFVSSSMSSSMSRTTSRSMSLAFSLFLSSSLSYTLSLGDSIRPFLTNSGAGTLIRVLPNTFLLFIPLLFSADLVYFGVAVKKYFLVECLEKYDTASKKLLWTELCASSKYIVSTLILESAILCNE